VAGLFILGAIIAGGAFAASRTGVDLRSLLDVRSVAALTGDFASPEASTPAPVTREATLVLPRRGEMILANARALMASGHFHDALTALESVRATDPQRADADRLRADIQRQLIGLATLPAVPEPAPSTREKGDRRLP
jgi:hypothetical protein